jgi:A/G-specific adenine glycosylase
MQYEKFQTFIWQYYTDFGRVLPWRTYIHHYHVLVSEIMLQQTQVSRVLVKFPEFLTAFPTIEALAHASLRDVLKVWIGLGYNRRAKFLHATAQEICNKFHGILPDDPTTLETLPGIGKNTAGSLCAFAYNKPVVFIETNIRRVYLQHFFPEVENVSDKELMPIITATLDTKNPREWYWALMDYGSYLKTQTPNPNRNSRHYTKQSKFEGSNRQVRAKIVHLITAHHKLTLKEINSHFPTTENRVQSNIEALIKEGFIALSGNIYIIKGST